LRHVKINDINDNLFKDITIDLTNANLR
jgi:hypothetical protein